MQISKLADRVKDMSLHYIYFLFSVVWRKLISYDEVWRVGHSRIYLLTDERTSVQQDKSSILTVATNVQEKP